MRSSILLFVLLSVASTFATTTTNGDATLQVGYIRTVAGRDIYGLSLNNGLTGTGLTNIYADCDFVLVRSDSSFSLGAVSPGELTYLGNLVGTFDNILPQATGWTSFSIPSSASGTGKTVTVIADYNGPHGIELIGGTFALSTSNVLGSREFQFEEESNNLVARTTLVSLLAPATAVQDPHDQTSWNSVKWQAGTSDLYNLSWNITNSDPTSSVTIGYQPSGNYIAHIVATRSASFSNSYTGTYGQYYEVYAAVYQIGSTTASYTYTSKTMELDFV